MEINRKQSIKKFQDELIKNIDDKNIQFFEDLNITKDHKRRILRFKTILKDNETNKFYLFVEVYNCVQFSFFLTIKETPEFVSLLNEHFFEFKNYKKHDIIKEECKCSFLFFVDDNLVYGQKFDDLFTEPFIFSNTGNKKTNNKFIKKLPTIYNKVFSKYNVYDNDITISDSLSIFVNKNSVVTKNFNNFIETEQDDDGMGIMHYEYVLRQEDKEYLFEHTINEKSNLYKENKVWFAEICYDKKGNNIEVKDIMTTTGLTYYYDSQSVFKDLFLLKIYYDGNNEQSQISQICANLDIFEKEIEKTFKKLVISSVGIDLILIGGIEQIIFKGNHNEQLRALARDIVNILEKKMLISSFEALEFQLRFPML